MEKPFDGCSMEIKTHVLTNTQHLDAGRQQTARGNIGAASQDDLTALGQLVDGKVDKEEGKGLSTNDFTNEEKRKLADAFNDRHTHENKDLLDGIDSYVSNAETDGTTLTIHQTSGDIEFTGETNVIESISQNGTPLEIVDKNVNITETIQSITVNGTQQTITDHNVDIHIDTPVSPYDENPEMDGTATPGQSSAYARGDHVHPADTTKADKVSSATSGNFAGLDANGNLTDSGSKAADFATVAQGALAETAYQKPNDGIPKADLNQSVQDSLDNADTALQEDDIVGKEDKSNKVVTWSGTPDDEHYPTEKLVKDSLDQIDADLSGKADKVVNATVGNFAGLDANGNLTDSGSKADDFATAAQGAKADSAIQGVKINDTLLIKDTNNFVNARINSIVPPTNNGEWIWSDEKDASNSMGWRQIVRDYVGNIQRDDTAGEPILDEEGHPITDAEDAADAVELWLRYKGIEFAARRAYDDETGENIHTAIHNRTTMAQVVEAIETALANYGGFKVVPLVNGVPDPSPDLPSEKFIYLTKENPSAKTDPYTEWIWITGTTDGHWDCIGETSIDLTGYWHGSIIPDGSGNVVTGISVVNGEVTVTKGKTVSDGANKVEASSTNGYIRIDGVETQVCDISGKADKVANAIAGNFAGLDGNGNLTNSGSKAADFATAAQGTKADSAVQGVQKNGTDIALDANKKANVVVNDAEFKVKLGSGSATKVFSADAETDSTLNIPLAAADSSGASTEYTEGLMAGQDKKKLDDLKNFSSVVISDGATPTPTTTTIVPADHNSALTFKAGTNVTLSAEPSTDPDTIVISATGGGDPVTVSGGKGISVTPSVDPTTSVTDYEVSVSGAIGCIGGKSSVNVTASDCDAIALPMADAFDSGNDRFIIQEDQTDHHVYLYALKTVSGQTPETRVDGVDMFMVTFNVNLTRSAIQSGVTQHGFYGIAGIKVLRKHSSVVTLADSSESYAAEVGAASINLTVTIQNNSGTETTIGGKAYYGYRFVYYGDAPAIDSATQLPVETIDLVSRLTSVEETVGIAEYSGVIPTYTAGTAIDMTSDVVSVQYNRGLMVNSNNQLEVRLGEGLDYLPDPQNPAIIAIGIHNDVEEVVEEVRELENTINTTVTTNMDFSDITGKFDLAVDGSHTGDGVLLGYTFTVPLANKLFLEDVANEWVTKIGVYAAQTYNQNYCIIGIYEFDFNQHPVPTTVNPSGYAGYTVPLCDTGRVTLHAGLNEFSIKHMNANGETELSFKPDCIYYAAIYVSKNCGQNLSLAGKPGYNDQFNDSLPVMSMDMCNLNLDLSDSSKTATELDAISFNDFGWWGGGSGSSQTPAYHECPSAHRFFMMVRNVKAAQSN